MCRKGRQICKACKYDLGHCCSTGLGSTTHIVSLANKQSMAVSTLRRKHCCNRRHKSEPTEESRLHPGRRERIEWTFYRRSCLAGKSEHTAWMSCRRKEVGSEDTRGRMTELKDLRSKGQGTLPCKTALCCMRNSRLGSNGRKDSFVGEIRNLLGNCQHMFLSYCLRKWSQGNEQHRTGNCYRHT